MDVDLLVSEFNNKLNRFLVRSRDPLDYMVDALEKLWD